MLSPEDAEFFSRVPIFAAVPAPAMRQLILVARRVDYDGPTLICSEGEPATEMFVVLRGTLEVRKRGRSGADTRIAMLTQGDVAGEMALIDIQPRSAAMRSLGPAALAVLTNGDLASLFNEAPDAYTILVLNIAREISRRLRRLDGLLADIITNVQDVWAGAMAEGAGRSQGLP